MCKNFAADWPDTLEEQAGGAGRSQVLGSGARGPWSGDGWGRDSGSGCTEACTESLAHGRGTRSCGRRSCGPGLARR